MSVFTEFDIFWQKALLLGNCDHLLPFCNCSFDVTIMPRVQRDPQLNSWSPPHFSQKLSKLVPLGTLQLLATSKAECSFQRPLIPEALSDHCALETTRERLFTLKLVIPTCTKPSHSLQPDWDFVAMWQCGNYLRVVAMSVKVWRSKTICPMAAHGQLSCARLKSGTNIK